MIKEKKEKKIKDESEKTTKPVNPKERPPIITVMGHIDHGKSTLLDYIRKSNTVDKEAGGITQHTSAYEVMHETPSGEIKRITFIDTPGHAAFSKMRSRGAEVADIVILVVAADDSVNVQTIEALKTIQEANTPFIVAINKIDKPNADIEKTKLDLASNGVFLEGYGGDVSNIPISAKTGEGIPELLDLLLLMAEMNGLKKDDNRRGLGFFLESNLHPNKGGIATLILINGTIRKGDFLIIDGNITPVRCLENFTGVKIDSAIASSPVRVIGFSKIPTVGSTFTSSPNKKDAEVIAKNSCSTVCSTRPISDYANAKVILPIILKGDFQGSNEAIEKELRKLETDDVKIKIICCGVGNITENDITMASGTEKPLVIGFNVKIDRGVQEVAQKFNVQPMTFDIIYKINEVVEEEIKKRMPKVQVEKIIGQARILKTFSRQKDKQVIGGSVLSGSIINGKKIKIIRQKNEIGRGEILELQEKKQKSREVKEGSQFGVTVDSKITISEGDIIEAFDIETV